MPLTNPPNRVQLRPGVEVDMIPWREARNGERFSLSRSRYLEMAIETGNEHLLYRFCLERTTARPSQMVAIVEKMKEIYHRR